MHTVYHGVDDLQARFEQARRDGGYVLADTALFLGLTAPQDVVPADVALTTNFGAAKLKKFFIISDEMPE